MKYISSLSSPLVERRNRRRLSILGSTGSIGASTLRVVAKNPESLEILALAGARNIELLASQAATFRPRYLGVLDQAGAKALAALLPADYKPEIVVGPSGYEALATLDEADLVLAAQVGAAGLAPALASARAGKILCLANKEALVLAGHLFRQTCASSGAVILPVDSEHNALFQALVGHGPAQASRLILTASGGPFRTKSLDAIQAATPAQALKHPNWSMGAKITIDSATMMNKGLEIIEAIHLYGAELNEVDVVVHPQSIVHSLVEYSDGSHLAQLGTPDMEIPIGYCLGYPRRLRIDLKRLDLASLATLTFEAPDDTRFPCLRLAREAMAASPSHPVVLNAANEIAVGAFLDQRVSFPGIARLIARLLETHVETAVPDLDSIQDLDAEIRIKAEQAIAEGTW
ncbi:MAG: 1-deoxy-D-xylulose-5-phosphate reductoisomerase [Deltaproteobacteria bacterium]|nr:1-deoxy-D-xylulose-5-phosphate reductoisomerase [Deltaproteobacteria bacterium]